MSFLNGNNILAFLALALASLLAFTYARLQRTSSRSQAPSKTDIIKSGIEQGDPLIAYHAISPLVDFDWKTTPPIKLRPFKQNYHLTMGLETIAMSDLIEMDNTYLSRIELRRQIMDSHPEATLACNSAAEPAALELYEWLVGMYLPRRFPTCFELVQPRTQSGEDNSSAQQQDQKQPTHLLNKITSENILLRTTYPLTALRTLGSHIDTDFLILLPKPQPSASKEEEKEPDSQQQQHTYHLEAFNTTFPSGFSTLSKLSLPLSEIHRPVPGYARKIGKSMDRFFARLETGKLFRRANWTITSTPELFAESGTHFHDFDGMSPAEQEASVAEQRAELRVGEMRLRCERQTLMRLPVSGALVFAFKTYLTTLEEVRGEGSGEALAQATEGFGRGSVPEMEIYKRVVVWGGLVREFLRG